MTNLLALGLVKPIGTHVGPQQGAELVDPVDEVHDQVSGHAHVLEMVVDRLGVRRALTTTVQTTVAPSVLVTLNTWLSAVLRASSRTTEAIFDHCMGPAAGAGGTLGVDMV